MQTPETSTTLLRCLGQDAQSARWGDFVERYEPVMRAFLASCGVTEAQMESVRRILRQER